MKELIILRHAKSNRPYGVEDINRPLSAEGIERIKKVSHNKDDFFVDTDVIISSPAKRALHTAMIMMNELDLPLEKLIIDRNLYTFSGFNVIDFVTILFPHNLELMLEIVLNFSLHVLFLPSLLPYDIDLPCSMLCLLYTSPSPRDS